MRLHAAGCLWFSFSCLLFGLRVPAQQQTPHLGPAKLLPEPYILLDNVVNEQWPATLTLVNSPSSIQYLSPGECVRAGVAVTGDDHQKLVSGIGVGFTVRMANTPQIFPVAPAAATKEIKPEGYDFVNGALHAAGVRPPDMSMASMAASSAKWCVPDDATAGPVEFDVVATFQNKASQLKPAALTIESMTSPQAPFSSADGVSQWIMTYYRDPRPALLVPAVSMLPPDQQTAPNVQEFLFAAFRADPAAAKLLGPQIATVNKATQILLLSLLAKAGVQLAQPPALDPQQQEYLKEVPSLPDPYDMAVNQQLFFKQDMLWGDFFATGSIKPVKSLASELAWRADYDAYEKVKESGQHPAALTDSLIRGVTFRAAGWSLGSFDRTDPLAADYIDAIAASPETSPAIRKELSGLLTDPAFRRGPDE